MGRRLILSLAVPGPNRHSLEAVGRAGVPKGALFRCFPLGQATSGGQELRPSSQTPRVRGSQSRGGGWCQAGRGRDWSSTHPLPAFSRAANAGWSLNPVPCFFSRSPKARHLSFKRLHAQERGLCFCLLTREVSGEGKVVPS